MCVPRAAVNLAPGKCTLPLQEAIDLMKSWKAEINDDVEKFAERAKSDSHCKTAATGGNLGFVVRKNLCQQFDDVLFTEEPGRVYGPITTPAGLHLIFLHSCREPRSRGEVCPRPFPYPRAPRIVCPQPHSSCREQALLGLPFDLTGPKKG